MLRHDEGTHLLEVCLAPNHNLRTCMDLVQGAGAYSRDLGHVACVHTLDEVSHNIKVEDSSKRAYEVAVVVGVVVQWKHESYCRQSGTVRRIIATNPVHPRLHALALRRGKFLALDMARNTVSHHADL